MATLNLPTDPRTAVWRLIVAQLQADPDLAREVAVWITWTGEDADNSPLFDLPSPALRLTPVIGPQSWYDAASERGSLVIEVEAWITGNDVEDMLNLQGAIEGALYPADSAAQWAFQQALVAAGAITGLIEFNDPLNEKLKQMVGQSGFSPVGTFKIDVQRTLIR